MKHQPKICKHCQGEFSDGRSDKKFCSTTCKTRHHKKKKRPKTDSQSEILELEIIIQLLKPGSENRKALTEVLNHLKMKNTQNKNCAYCEKQFITNSDQEVYCSSDCYEAAGTERLLRDIFKQTDNSAEQTHHFFPGLGHHTHEVNSGTTYQSFKRLKHIQDFWTFCNATLWPDMDFSEEQQNLFRRLIGRYFDNKRCSELVFVELIERVCVLRIYFNRYRDIKIPQPENWLRGSRYCNLKCSQLWHEDFLKKIERGKELASTIKEVASAYHRFVQGNNLLVVSALRRELIDNKQPELLQIFYNAVMHQLFFQH